jgi:branched-subunit amino acid ABC-type transport system permease component
MNRAEKALVLVYGVALAAYIPCFFLLMDGFFAILLPIHFLLMILGLLVALTVFRDLYKRPFSNPNDKATWAILFLLCSPSIVVYLYRHGFRPRDEEPRAAQFSLATLIWIMVALACFCAGLACGLSKSIDESTADKSAARVPLLDVRRQADGKQ